jgi:hypothetical protein
VREEPVTANQLMEEMDPAVLKRVVNAMVYLMKEKFIEMVKQRQIFLARFIVIARLHLALPSFCSMMKSFLWRVLIIITLTMRMFFVSPN